MRTASDVQGLFGGTRRISVALYNELVADPGKQKLVELLLANYADSRGVYKRTYQNRFDRFDSVVIELITRNFGGSKKLRVHDAGASDGRTSLNFFTRLSEYFPLLEYVASDFETELTVRKYGEKAIVLNQSGNIHEIVFPPFVFNLCKLESFKTYPLNYLALLLARRSAAHLLGKDHSEQFIVRLFCPLALKLAGSDPRFSLMEHNLLNPLPPMNYNVVRAMNVLNPSYFDEAQLWTVASHIHDALGPNGLLVFGSNDSPESEVRGGIYRRVEGKFEKLQSFQISAMDAILAKFSCPAA